MAVSLQFQQRIPFVDRDGRLSNDGIRALNSLALQIQQIAELYGITDAIGLDLAALSSAPVITSAPSASFSAEHVLSATTPIQLFYAAGTAQITFSGYTDDVPEGVINLYFTLARARLAISGSTTVSYNNSSGVLSLTSGNVATALGYTPYDAANPAGYITQTQGDGRYVQPGGASSLNIRTITATVTPSATDYTLLCDASAGAVVINLAAAAGQNKRILAIKKTDASANTVTIDPNGTELIDGAATFVLTAQYDGITAHCNGTGWWII